MTFNDRDKRNKTKPMGLSQKQKACIIPDDKWEGNHGIDKLLADHKTYSKRIHYNPKN